MKFSTALLSALSLGLALAAPHRGHNRRPNFPTNTTIDSGSNATNTLDETPGSGGSWNVLIDEDDPRTLDEMIAAMDLRVEDLTYVYNNSAFKGFAAPLSTHCVDKLQNMTGWRSYEPKMEIKLHDITPATWGLKRISQVEPVAVQSNNVADANFRGYVFEGSETALGAGVDIYILDTGVNIEHADFEGRATFPWSFDKSFVDDVGHGTHCAGTAASKTFGVAKAANIIAVRVLGANGGSSDGVAAGVDFVVSQHDKRKLEDGFRGSVISMSLGTASISTVTEDAILLASKAGIHISVAAGNDDQDACVSSPGHASRGSNILSVGAVNIDDARASFSNFGECVSVYAPGQDVTSTWINFPGEVNSINTISGTSMATPHVTGLIAYHLGLNPFLAEDPASMKQLIINSAISFNSDKSFPDPAIEINNGILKQTARK